MKGDLKRGNIRIIAKVIIQSWAFLYNGAILGLEFHWVTGLLSCVSTAQPASRTVLPILFGGQYRSTDLPIMFLAGRGPLWKHNSNRMSKKQGKRRERIQETENWLRLHALPYVWIVTIIAVVTHHEHIVLWYTLQCKLTLL